MTEWVSSRGKKAESFRNEVKRGFLSRGNFIEELLRNRLKIINVKLKDPSCRFRASVQMFNGCETFGLVRWPVWNSPMAATH